MSVCLVTRRHEIFASVDFACRRWWYMVKVHCPFRFGLDGWMVGWWVVLLAGSYLLGAVVVVVVISTPIFMRRTEFAQNRVTIVCHFMRINSLARTPFACLSSHPACNASQESEREISRSAIIIIIKAAVHKLRLDGFIYSLPIHILTPRSRLQPPPPTILIYSTSGSSSSPEIVPLASAGLDYILIHFAFLIECGSSSWCARYHFIIIVKLTSDSPGRTEFAFDRSSHCGFVLTARDKGNNNNTETRLLYDDDDVDEPPQPQSRLAAGLACRSGGGAQQLSTKLNCKGSGSEESSLVW